MPTRKRRSRTSIWTVSETDRQMIVLSGWMAGSSYWTEEEEDEEDEEEEEEDEEEEEEDEEDEEEEEEEEEACQIKTVEQFTKTGSRKT
jgi:flagellar biosynthesis component FlhA